MPRKKVTLNMIKMMRYMRREGESVAEIADKLGLPHKTVLRYLGKERSLGEWKKTSLD